MEHQTSSKIITGLLLMMSVLVVTTSAEAKTYVSLKGNFYITYPDDWIQVGYQTVDAYLLRNKAGKPILDYEAAFAPENSDPFFSGDYFVLTVDSVGKLSDTQIDSVLNDLSKVFNKEVKYYPVGDFLTNLVPNAPGYDAQSKTVTILNDVTEQQQVLKKNLIMMRFYDSGIATFYFYSLDSVFDASKLLFERIAASLSTEGVENALPQEHLKVARIKGAKGLPEGQGWKAKKAYLFFGVALVLLAVILIRRFR